MKPINSNISLNYRYKAVLLFCLLMGFSSHSYSQNNERRYIDLEGSWKFSIGDDQKWSEPGFNDSNWEEIMAPSYWENQGFWGYDGYAWYRKHFYCPSNLKGKMIYLHMGYIDDVDEVYLNGKLVGASGKFPPNYETAYNAYRKYPIPEGLLNLNGKNIISVRVYDSQQGGGLAKGDLGLYALEMPVQPDIVLEGMWKFRTGDNMAWRENTYNDNEWKEIIVPAFWEGQGYQEYDGFAWYRRDMNISDNLRSKQLVLLLGKIDDKDEVYFNGRLIGHTGNMKDPEINQSDYQQFRGYFIPKDLVQRENVIAVRVYDGWRDGGIYEGPVGVMTQEKYSTYWKMRRQNARYQQQQEKKNFWELLFGN